MRSRWLSLGLMIASLGALPAAAQTCKPAIADSDLVTPGKLDVDQSHPAAAAVRR